MATMTICGNLKIEQAMRDCIGVICTHIPVDRMFLQIYEPDLGAMRTVATASADEAKQLDLLTPMPPEARKRVRENLHRFVEGAVIVESSEQNPVATEMLRFHGIVGWSVLRMTLSTEAGRLAGVVLTAEGPDRYGEGHVELLGLLKEPFAIALSNTLQHREVTRLRDRLTDDNQYLRRELQKIAGDALVGADFGLKEVMRMVHQVAPTESPVLLTGETGVGKDLDRSYRSIVGPSRTR
jgi:transcriptional regulator with GAF, ATPase, and Fis domain